MLEIPLFFCCCSHESPLNPWSAKRKITPLISETIVRAAVSVAYKTIRSYDSKANLIKLFPLRLRGLVINSAGNKWCKTENMKLFCGIWGAPQPLITIKTLKSGVRETKCRLLNCDCNWEDKRRCNHIVRTDYSLWSTSQPSPVILYLSETHLRYT